MVGKHRQLESILKGTYKFAVILVNDVYSEQSFNVIKDHRDPFQNPRMTERLVAGRGWTTLAADGSRTTFAKLMVLDFFLESIYLQKVDYYGPLIYPILPEKKRVEYSFVMNPHLQVPLGLFEPRLSAKSKEAFREIQDAEGILRSVNNLTESIRYVIAAIGEDTMTGNETTTSASRGAKVKMLESLCKERRSNAQRALEALNPQLDYLAKRHSIREAKSVKRLTILASIYLPLALAAAILGMQTPFKQLVHSRTDVDDPSQNDSQKDWLIGTNPSFDFLGLFIVFACITIFILQVIKLGLWLKSHGLGMLSKQFHGPFSVFYYGRKWKFGGANGLVFDIMRKATAWWLGADLSIALLVLFIIGMRSNGPTTWDAAWKVFLVYGVVGGVLLLSSSTFYFYLRGGMIEPK